MIKKVIYSMIMIISGVGASCFVGATESVTANFSGSLITSTCTVSGGYKNIIVDLGKIDANTISQIGEKGPWIDFPEPITLICPSVKNIVMALESTTTEPGFSDYIALAPWVPGNAKGVAIAISVDGGQSVYPLNTGRLLPGSGETRNLHLKAAYVRTLPAHAVKIGAVNATAHFVLKYE
jgi:type 1 fimbria pilin